ncbi:MAG: SGNH/GDSL hydrolase family protein [Candidatus Eisenbacteria bacterium]|mgnify:CR=1 FL=1|nr:SGNH/GDSL hydrolase family protein [Candidatus Eisenbacteria bacterium]
MVRQIGFRLVLLMTSLAIALLAAEFALRLALPIPDPYATTKEGRIAGFENSFIRSQFAPDYTMTTLPEPGLPGVSGSKRFTVNNFGYRGPTLTVPKPKGELRIFLVGGSSTECLYLDDSESLDAVLQRELQTDSDCTVRVHNAGKSGDASDDHVSMLVHRIVHLEPDLIIVFAGLNDLGRAIYNHDYLHLDAVSQPNRPSPLLLLASEFQVFRRMYYTFKRVAPSEKEILEGVTQTTNYRKKVAVRQSYPITDGPPRVDHDPYEANLRTLAGAARANGARVVFLTQQTTWNSTVDPKAEDWHWLTLLNGVRYREDELDRALEGYNDVMRRVATQLDVPLLDLSASLVKSLDFFYDDVHFNVRGAQQTAQSLAQMLRDRGLCSCVSTEGR